MKMLFSLALAAFCLTALPAPALAAPPPPIAGEGKSPFLAGTLNFAGPLALTAAMLAFPVGPFGDFGIYAIPFGFGGGHLYAGDYRRAGLASLGGAATVYGVTLGGVLIDAAANGFAAKSGIYGMMIGGTLGYLAAATLTTLDATATADRVNRDGLTISTP